MKYLHLLFIICLCSCSSDEPQDNDTTIYVESIEIFGADITTGSTTQMTATVLPANASNKTIIWKSSDVAIANVSSTGLVTAKQNGTVTITGTAADRGTISNSTVITISGITPPINGTIVSTVAELTAALAIVKPGETIVMNGGTYTMTSKITISQSGTATNPISLIANQGARPKLDFSIQSESSSNQGIVLTGNYWLIKGLDIFKAGDNGMQIKGSNNIIEFCTFSECADSGLQIDNGAANNTILNCDSNFNADSTLENADGFACKLNAGTGNKFIGCRAWQNLDDGWDGYLRGTDNITTTYENCWAIKNGYLKSGAVGKGDGNGFKTGGSDDKLLKHNATYTNCVAVGNVTDGFDHNSNRGEVTIYNASAYQNGRNYSFSNTNPLAKLTLKNCDVLGDYGSTNATITDVTNNSWQNGLTATVADFLSIDYNQLLNPRKADGSLPDVTFFHLTPTSNLIDKGVNVGLPYTGSAPDLGAFEF